MCWCVVFAEPAFVCAVFETRPPSSWTRKAVFFKCKRPFLAQATVGAADAMRVLGWTKQMFELYCAKADFGVRRPPPPHRATARRVFP